MGPRRNRCPSPGCHSIQTSRPRRAGPRNRDPPNRGPSDRRDRGLKGARREAKQDDEDRRPADSGSDEPCGGHAPPFAEHEAKLWAGRSLPLISMRPAWGRVKDARRGEASGPSDASPARSERRKARCARRPRALTTPVGGSHREDPPVPRSGREPRRPAGARRPSAEGGRAERSRSLGRETDNE